MTNEARQISEKLILEKGFKQVSNDKNLFIKKLLTSNQIWMRCRNCSLFAPEPITIAKNQRKFTYVCVYEKNDDGSPGVTNHYELPGIQMTYVRPKK